MMLCKNILGIIFLMGLFLSISPITAYSIETPNNDNCGVNMLTHLSSLTNMEQQNNTNGISNKTIRNEPYKKEVYKQDYAWNSIIGSIFLQAGFFTFVGGCVAGFFYDSLCMEVGAAFLGFVLSMTGKIIEDWRYL